MMEEPREITDEEAVGALLRQADIIVNHWMSKDNQANVGSKDVEDGFEARVMDKVGGVAHTLCNVFEGNTLNICHVRTGPVPEGGGRPEGDISGDMFPMSPYGLMANTGERDYGVGERMCVAALLALWSGGGELGALTAAKDEFMSTFRDGRVALAMQPHACDMDFDKGNGENWFKGLRPGRGWAAVEAEERRLGLEEDSSLMAYNVCEGWEGKVARARALAEAMVLDGKLGMVGGRCRGVKL